MSPLAPRLEVAVISSGEGSMVEGRTPLPDEPTKPIDHDGDVPVYPAQVPVREAPKTDAPETPRAPTEQPPSDPTDVVPGHQAGYHTLLPELPEGQRWDDGALAPFFGSLHKAQLRPSQAKAVLDYYAPTVAFLRSEALNGNLDSALEKAAIGLKMRLENKGATRPQIESVIRAALAWIEPRAGYDGAPAIFGMQTDPAKAFASEKPAGITMEMHELMAKLQTATPGIEKDKLLARWNALFHHRGDYAQDD